MKLFSQKEKAFYLFKDDELEDGVVCHKFDFTPGALRSGLFTSPEAIAYLAKTDSQIKFLDLDNTVYCFIKTRHKTYCAQYDGANFASIVGSLVESGFYEMCCPTDYFDYLASLEGEIFFIADDGVMMIEMWIGKIKGAFRYTNPEQFIKNVEKFVERIEEA